LQWGSYPAVVIENAVRSAPEAGVVTPGHPLEHGMRTPLSTRRPLAFALLLLLPSGLCHTVAVEWLGTRIDRVGTWTFRMLI
jgi:hypothetical protein